MKLSILICTLPQRWADLSALMGTLNPQILPDVEVVISSDDMIKSIGQKRNDLLDAAKGDYVCFIDDDDQISDQYVFLMLNALATEPDCVGINGVMYSKGRTRKPFTHSIKHGRWYEDSEQFYRTPNHWNPIRRELAQQVRFKPINHGEDHDYSNRILPLLKTEVYVEPPVYYYQFDGSKSMALKRKNEC